jgi:hypothetical protein
MALYDCKNKGEIMEESLQTQIMELKNASIEKLQGLYRELFNVTEVSYSNKLYLTKKIAYKLQEKALGGLSDKTKLQIANLIEKYDPINNKALRPQIISAGKKVTSLPFMRDKRLPIPGTIIYKKYKGQNIHIKVLDKGFEYKDRYYKSLSAVAFEITDSHWNGFDFFSL